MRVPAILLLLLLVAVVAVSGATPIVLSSPDGNLRLTFSPDGDGRIAFSFAAHGMELLRKSSVGFDGGKFTGISSRSVNAVWKPVWGKRAEVSERFNEITIGMTSYRLIARVYDNGAAFRYEGGSGPERTVFRFAGDYTAWSYNGERHNLGPEKLSESGGIRLPVMTVRADENRYMAIHEADLSKGEPMVLSVVKGEAEFRISSKPGEAWRVILFGRTPGELVDSHLIELLNPPPASGEDFSWVKPGVALWDWRINGAKADGFTYGMSLTSWKRMVDFASENGFCHLVLDANWYGPEFSGNSDPSKGGKADQVREIIAYGKTKGVGIWLYLNDVGGRKFPLENTLRQYREWGAAGVKYGFMRGTPEEKNNRTRMITELCSQNRLLCDFHDGPVHPYGQMRTFPNAVTREFCHSQLDAKRTFDPKTFVTSVFVNMLAGPLDMNNGVAELTQAGRKDNGSPVPSTLAGEAARTLIVFSGATIIPDIPENYRKHPALLRFLAAQKQPWRESKTLGGTIGESIVMARQASDGNWLVGAATNEQSREVTIPLSFLGNGNYAATIVEDGDDSDFRTHVESIKETSRNVTSADSITVRLAPGGGACVLLKQSAKH